MRGYTITLVMAPPRKGAYGKYALVVDGVVAATITSPYAAPPWPKPNVWVVTFTDGRTQRCEGRRAFQAACRWAVEQTQQGDTE